MDKNNFFRGKGLTFMIGIILCIVLFSYYKPFEALPKEEKTNPDVVEEKEEPKEEEKDLIMVHISGEVIRPGIVELNKGQRLYEALELAGGATENGDVNAVNLALVLEDQQKIVIPPKGQVPSLQGKQEKDMVNINTADQSELMKLPGIGQTIADSIVQYREENNGFNKIEELKNVTRIGDATFEKLKDKVKCY